MCYEVWMTLWKLLLFLQFYHVFRLLCHRNAAKFVELIKKCVLNNCKRCTQMFLFSMCNCSYIMWCLMHTVICLVSRFKIVFAWKNVAFVSTGWACQSELVQDRRPGVQSFVRTCTAIPRSCPLSHITDLPGHQSLCSVGTSSLVVPPIRLSSVAIGAFPDWKPISFWSHFLDISWTLTNLPGH